MSMQRVVILGRGGAGKSTVARRLGEAFGLPVIELDRHFWQAGLVPLPKGQWVKVQPVHQVSDWGSGAAAYFGWMREAKRENTRCGL
jgi:hypothetical protein